jgi:hypothetical protein
VLALIRRSDVPLDDDQIALAAHMNRIYVNAICRQLAQDELIVRARSGAGKIVNSASGSIDLARHGDVTRDTSAERGLWHPRRRSAEWLTERIQQLTASFAECVSVFEASEGFPGPSLYFHLRAIERRRAHHAVSSLLEDDLFLEYVYAVLPAWGMHRMGPQAAKVDDFAHITTALRKMAPELQQLWPLHITTLSEQAAREAAATAWDVIAHIKVSTSRTQIVAGSKFLHHLLPDLVPPIDRQYTFTFFTGQKTVPSDRAAFLDWFPRLADIGARCRDEIQAAIARGGFMATGEAKVIDNAIMGFMQQRRSGVIEGPVDRLRGPPRFVQKNSGHH